MFHVEHDEIRRQIGHLIDRMRAADFLLLPGQVERFSTYLTKVLSWNRRTNLISKNDEPHIVSRHFLASIAVLEVFQLPPHCQLIDIGTGAGFPGLPMKIMREDIQLTLLDSKRMKSLFLKDLIRELKLDGIRVITERAEVASVKPEFHHQYDVIIARAVTDLLHLYKWCHPFLRSAESEILAIKGGDLGKEILALRTKYEKINIETRPFISKLVDTDKVLVIMKEV